MSKREKITAGAKIVPHLWFVREAAEAARFYASVFPDSRVDHVTPIPADTPSGPAGSVDVVEFTLAGQPFMAISAGPLDPFNHAISFLINCDTQAEIDHYWGALSAGGSVEQCGWLKDRYGVSWQVSPTALGDMMRDPDRAKAKRVMEAMMKMVKLDIAALEAAYAGTSPGDGAARRPRPGKFVWFEHASNDAKKAQAFFAELLGWKTFNWNDTTYEMIAAGGEGMDAMIGAYTSLREGEKPRWVSCVSVDDVDRTAKAVAENGGEVVEPPHDLPGVGRGARILDPQGAELFLFKSDAGDPPDPPLAEAPPASRFFWCELHTTQPAEATAFYEKALGYTRQTMDMGPAGAYHVLERDGIGRGGVTGHLGGAAPHWLPYISVENPDATVALARKLGGKILVGAEDIPGVGRFAVLQDPTGVAFAVMKALPPKGAK